MKTCKHCNQPVSGQHFCSAANRTIREDDDGDVILSAVVGYATNSAIIGGLIGGDITGAIVGDLLNGGDLLD